MGRGNAVPSSARSASEQIGSDPTQGSSGTPSDVGCDARGLVVEGIGGWITHHVLAKRLGLASARAARDWCKRHSVPYRRDGKHNFVQADDVVRAVEALPVANARSSSDERQIRLEQAVTFITKRPTSRGR